MKKSIYLFGWFFSLILTTPGFAQDLIHKRTGETIKARILEVNTEELKYRRFDEPEGPIYAIEKAFITKVEYENGRKEQYQDNFSNAELYTGQHRNALKAGFLAPLTGQTTLSFERNLKPGQSFEIKMGIIGLGRKFYRPSSGLYFSGAYRFYRTPDFYYKGMRYAHILKGAYFKPEVIAGRYSQKEMFYLEDRILPEKSKITFGALMLNFGKQWVFNNIFLVDLSGGVGYAFDGAKSPSGYASPPPYHFSLIKLSDSGLAFSSTLSVGILF